MLAQVFSIVFPVFAIVLVGFFYGRKFHTNLDVANRLNIEVFIPALLFSILSTRSFALSDMGWLLLGGGLVVLLSGVIALPFAKLFGWDTKTFLPPIMFNNSGNMGLPLALFAFGEEALPAAVLLFIVENNFHMTVGMKMLNRQASIIQIFKMPMLVATFLGLLCSIYEISIPEALIRPIDMLGQIAIPLMLFSLGVRLVEVNLNDWKMGLFAAILTPVSGLIVAGVFLMFVKLPHDQYQQLILFAALPPAVLNYMMAEKFNQEPAKVASIVMMGNIGSVVVIPLVLWFILPN